MYIAMKIYPSLQVSVRPVCLSKSYMSVQKRLPAGTTWPRYAESHYNIHHFAYEKKLTN